jgi:hypothetical protein
MPNRDCYICERSLPEIAFLNAIYPVEFAPPGRPMRNSEPRKLIDLVKVGKSRVWICKDCWPSS